MSGNNDEFYVGSIPNERHTFNSMESSLDSYMATMATSRTNSSLTTQTNNLSKETNNLQKKVKPKKKKINSEDESVDSEDSSTVSEYSLDDELAYQSNEEELQFTMDEDELQFTENHPVKISGDDSKINQIIHQTDDHPY